MIAFIAELNDLSYGQPIGNAYPRVGPPAVAFIAGPEFGASKDNR
jgi:hypothetical protein